MVGDTIKLLQSIMITYFLFRVLSLDGNFKFEEVLYQLLMTITCYFVCGRKSSIQAHMIASLSLTYMCNDNFTIMYRLISLIYIIKFFKLKKNLAQLSEIEVWKKPFFKYIRFFFIFTRYFVLEYLFLGFLIMGYKLYSYEDPQKLPSDFKIYYQMIVTATTIGYGDVCPQTKHQMIYFTLSIPLICGSFVIFINHVTSLYNQTFFSSPEGSPTSPQTAFQNPSPSKIASILKKLSFLQVVIISWFMFKVFSFIQVNLSFIEVGIEVSSTILFFIISGRKSKIIINLVSSLSLLVLCPLSFLVPYKYLCALYFIKFFHVRSILRDFSKILSTITWIPLQKYVNFMYNYLRHSVLEYLFLAFTIMWYKIYSAGDAQKLPPDYKLYYQWLVTSATIGYGDITPKSDNQIIFMTIIIPIICFSFAVYLNNLIAIFTDTFLLSQKKEGQA